MTRTNNSRPGTITLPPIHPAADAFPLLRGEAFDGLVESIRKHGQREPCILWRGQLLDGRNRWRACDVLGIKPSTRSVDHLSDEGAVVEARTRNLDRRDLTEPQRALAVLTCDGLLRQIAERNLEKQRAAGGLGGRPPKNPGVNVATRVSAPQVVSQRAAPAPSPAPRRRDDSGRTIYQAAAEVKIAPRALRDIAQATRDRPDVAAAISSGVVSSNAEAKKLAKMPAPERAAAVKAVESGASADLKAAMRTVVREGTIARAATIEPPSSLKGPFAVIVADPPWCYDKRSEDGSHRAALPYTSMSIEEIVALPMPPLCDDAVLWLWTTNAHLEHAWSIARAWGFDRVPTILTWVKDRMGTGDWLRGQTEHCLVCVRGRPMWTLTNQTTVLRGPLRAHSQKPDEFFAMLDSLCPDPRRLELFSRQPRKGWIVWGADAQQ